MKFFPIVLAIFLLVSVAAKSEDLPELAGLTSFVWEVHGHATVFLPTPTYVESVTRAVGSGETVALLMSGPSRFLFLEGPGITYPLVYSEQFTLNPGVYHVYGMESGESQLLVAFHGLGGETNVGLEGHSGSFRTTRLLGLAEEDLPLPSRMDRASMETVDDSAVIVVQNSEIVGGGPLVKNVWHRFRQNLTHSECRPAALDAYLGTGGIVSSGGSSAFLAQEGLVEVGVDYAAIGSWITTKHAALGLTIPLAERDPLLEYANPFWQMVYSLKPIDRLPPFAQSIIEEGACTHVPGTEWLLSPVE